uniref:Uncharacterized protein n=1 Tax=uncultured bacterium pBE3-1 TaxID=1781161 RepID=A0A1C9U550_9BACT|nr:hypothetical protein [uncultured bacterium pBE3-1]
MFQPCRFPRPHGWRSQKRGGAFYVFRAGLVHSQFSSQPGHPHP